MAWIKQLLFLGFISWLEMHAWAVPLVLYTTGANSDLLLLWNTGQLKLGATYLDAPFLSVPRVAHIAN